MHDLSRIKHTLLVTKVMSARQAAALIHDGMVVGASGFTRSGDSKAVLAALAEKAECDHTRITLMTGASLGQGTDGVLATAGAIVMRLPFQSDPVMRTVINQGGLSYIDENLSETAAHIRNGFLPPIDIAIIEAAYIEADGSIVPTTSVGNSAIFVQQARQVIVEINEAVPASVRGIHDVFLPEDPTGRAILPITEVWQRIGQDVISCNPDKISAIVFTNQKDSPAETTADNAVATAIAGHLLHFFESEIAAGRLTRALRPIQAGIGKIADAVLSGLAQGDFEHLTMYSEVLQDSTFRLIDSGKMDFASGSSMTLSEGCYRRVFADFEHYRHKILLRPQDITNAAEIIQRLGIIAINTALECDIYGNVNSSHISGSHIVNGIGGSADFAQNSYLSIFVTESITKGGKISRIVPMVTHVDHSEHDVDVIVTEQGLADLRGLSPRQKAQAILSRCVHPDYQPELDSYFERACLRGGHTPHLLEEAFQFYTNLAETGAMKTRILESV
ncbi:MAG: propionyl-CoA--succinate CoA transferase [Dyadobacter sp. 50-39]|uniref:succinate CoA transferase n=1 Tax=Dyadobacter sp. 50-39 TaxID=1895756 RepID=UPI000965A688|nr:succinate CoA transferase [Dyadobacter sp. 50-39]OJV21756.1 MAG: propionyl-CoA--succinate CoA transferase [Dyadobacter sp. 50-39]